MGIGKLIKKAINPVKMAKLGTKAAVKGAQVGTNLAIKGAVKSTKPMISLARGSINPSNPLKPVINPMANKNKKKF